MPCLLEIGPVILERKMRMWNVYKNTDDERKAIRKTYSSFQLRWAKIIFIEFVVILHNYQSDFGLMYYQYISIHLSQNIWISFEIKIVFWMFFNIIYKKTTYKTPINGEYISVMHMWRINYGNQIKTLTCFNFRFLS